MFSRVGAELDVQLNVIQAVLDEAREIVADVRAERMPSISHAKRCEYSRDVADIIGTREAQIARVAELCARMYRVRRTIRTSCGILTRLRQVARDEYAAAIQAMSVPAAGLEFPLVLEEVDSIMPDGTTYKRQHEFMLADARRALQNVV
jgi:hypothetical protein